MPIIDQYRTGLSIFFNASICKIIRPVIRMKLGLVLQIAAENSEKSGKILLSYRTTLKEICRLMI